MNLMKSQWKLRQQHEDNFPMKENHGRANTSIRRKKEIQ